MTDMRNPDRIKEILEIFEAVWRHYPDLRMGQLVEIIYKTKISGDSKADLFNLEDSIFLEKLKKFKEGYGAGIK